MSFVVSGQPLPAYAKLADNADNTIFTATKRTTVIAISFTETNGGTHTLAIWRRDAANAVSHYVRSALALTARQHGNAIADDILVLNKGDTLHAQSGSASGYVDLWVTYLAPDALAAT